jgi:hypothetical protein
MFEFCVIFSPFSALTTHDQVEYDTVDLAVDAVLRGETNGVVHLRRNFSMATLDRGIFGLDSPNETLHQSRIEVRLDNTSEVYFFNESDRAGKCESSMIHLIDQNSLELSIHDVVSHIKRPVFPPPLLV